MMEAKRLTWSVLNDRLRDHVYLLYVNFGFFTKGAVMVVAGAALYFIFFSDAPYLIQRYCLWFVSFGFSIVTLATWSRGAVFTNWHINGWDFVLPLATGLFEGLLYVVLTPDKAGLLRWVYWYAVFGLLSLFASGLVLNRLVQARRHEYAEDEKLNKLLRKYKTWLRTDAIAAFALGLISLGIFSACLHFPILQAPSGWPFHAIAALLLGFVAGTTVYNSANHYRSLSDSE